MEDKAQTQSVPADVDTEKFIMDEGNENETGSPKNEKEETESAPHRMFKLAEPVLDLGATSMSSALSSSKSITDGKISDLTPAHPTSYFPPSQLPSDNPPTCSSASTASIPVPVASSSSSTCAPPPPVFKEELTAYQRHGKDLVDYLKSPRSEAHVRFCQRDAVLGVIKLLEDDKQQPGYNGVHEPVLIKAPAGSGKSGIIALLPYALEAKKVLALTPSEILSEQLASVLEYTVTRNEAFIQKIGFCGLDNEFEKKSKLEKVTLIKDRYNPDQHTDNFTVINVQKFGNGSKTCLDLKSKFWDPAVIRIVSAAFKLHDLLIVDEAHHFPAETWQKVTELFLSSRASDTSRKVVILLTATTTRGDGSPILANQAHRIAYSIGAEKLEGVTIRKMEFIEKEIRKGQKSSNKDVYFDICQILASQRGSGFEPQAMILVPTKNAATKMANDLNSFSHNTEFAVAIIGNSESKGKTAQFSAGMHSVAVICQMLKEGYSNNKVTLCVIHRKTNSQLLFEQFIGRCSRLRKPDENGVSDTTTGVVLSYPEFKQRKMWEARNKLAEDDIEEEKVHSESSVPKCQKRTVSELSSNDNENCTFDSALLHEADNGDVDEQMKKKNRIMFEVDQIASYSAPLVQADIADDNDEGVKNNLNEEEKATMKADEIDMQDLSENVKKGNDTDYDDITTREGFQAEPSSSKLAPLNKKRKIKKTSVQSDSQEFEVEKILQKRKINKYVDYLVRWSGFDETHDTWEPSANLSKCRRMISQFNKSNDKNKNK